MLTTSTSANSPRRRSTTRRRWRPEGSRLPCARNCLRPTRNSTPDAKPALEALKGAGAQLAILSNGSPAMLESAIRAAGLDGLFDAVLSVDARQVFKTAPTVYTLATEHFDVDAGEVSFQSSNRWDIAAASLFGFRAVWINRAGLPDEYPDMAPAAVLRGLDELPGLPD